MRIYILDKSGYIPMNRSRQAGALKEAERSALQEGLSALLSGRFRLMRSLAASRRKRREKIQSIKELQQVYPRVVNLGRVGADLGSGNRHQF